MVTSKGTKIAQISVQKIKTAGALSGLSNHNKRLDTGDKSKAVWIDDSRTILNQTLLSNVKTNNYLLDILNEVTGKNYTEEDIESIDKDNLRYTDGRKIRNDVVFAGGCKIGYPGDLKWVRLDENLAVKDALSMDEVKAEDGYFEYPADEKEFKEWQARTIDFLKDRFGEENILEVQCHMDEGCPHIHAVFSPTYTDDKGIKRLGYNTHFINGKGLTPEGSLVGGTAQLQDEYAAYFTDMGYSRGEQFSSNKHKVNGMTATKARALMQKTFDEVPKPVDKDIIQAAIDSRDWKEKNRVLQESFEAGERLYEYSQKASLESQMAKVKESQIESDGHYISTLRSKNKDLKDKIKEMEKSHSSEIQTLQNKITELQNSIKREECREKGMTLYHDQDLIKDIKELEEKLTKEGSAWYKEHGIDMEYEGEAVEKTE